MHSLLRAGYSGVTTAGSLLLAPCFLCAARGRARLPERFGLWSIPQTDASWWWFHGASLGEITAILPLIKETKRQYPQDKILVTATSVTGLDKAKDEAHATALLPFDSPLWIRYAMKRLPRIKAFVCTETELWPNVLHQLAKRSIPLFLVNARISDYTLKHYQAIKKIMRDVVGSFTLVCAGDEDSLRRFALLGVPPHKLVKTGSTKYDVATSPGTLAKQEERRKLFGNDAPVVTLGSIRPGEDEILFAAIEKIRDTGKKLNVIVVPRHQEKFAYFNEALRKRGWDFTKRSAEQGQPPRENLLLDTYGELLWAYSLSDLAFVGASLVDIGGHNPFEPAAYGVPVFMGPFARNVKEEVRQLRAAHALWEVRDAKECEDLLQKLFAAPKDFQDAGARAAAVAAQHRGATEVVMKKIAAVVSL